MYESMQSLKDGDEDNVGGYAGHRSGIDLTAFEKEPWVLNSANETSFQGSSCVQSVSARWRQQAGVDAYGHSSTRSCSDPKPCRHRPCNARAESCDTELTSSWPRYHPRVRFDTEEFRKRGNAERSILVISDKVNGRE